MNWIMIIIVLAGTGVHTNTVRFENKELCESAAKQITGSAWSQVKVTCAQVAR